VVLVLNSVCLDNEYTWLGCGRGRIPLGSHICWFYNCLDDRESVLIPFLKAGIDTHERCNCIMAEQEQHWLKSGLQRQGVDVPAAISSGQLSLWDPVEVYCSKGYFDDEEKNHLWDNIYLDSRNADYSLVRLVADMDWVAGQMPSEKKLLEYEIGLDHRVRKNQGVAICQYNLAKFKGGTIINLLKAHPIVIWGGVAVRNPFYVEPVVLREQMELE
jgi:hypothetical protein